jgi:hypothetical protein
MSCLWLPKRSRVDPDNSYVVAQAPLLVFFPRQNIVNRAIKLAGKENNVPGLWMNNSVWSFMYV